MSEPSAIWMFLSILTICVTWYKVVNLQREKAAEPAKKMMFQFNGVPVNGSLELIVDGKSSRFKLVDGKIA